jgi:hypothetical protein
LVCFEELAIKPAQLDGFFWINDGFAHTRSMT